MLLAMQQELLVLGLIRNLFSWVCMIVT